MMMNGEYLTNIADLKRCFSLEELLYSYYNGELEIFLEQIGEHQKAKQIQEISAHNALLLIRLYQVFDIPYEQNEEEIRATSASNL